MDKIAKDNFEEIAEELKLSGTATFSKVNGNNDQQEESGKDAKPATTKEASPTIKKWKGMPNQQQ